MSRGKVECEKEVEVSNPDKIKPIGKEHWPIILFLTKAQIQAKGEQLRERCEP